MRLTVVSTAILALTMSSVVASAETGVCDNTQVEVATTPAPSQSPLNQPSFQKALSNMPTDTDTVLLGDSIMQQWKPTQEQDFGDRKVWNFGVGSDRTQNILWRLQSRDLKRIKPRDVILMVGVNNLFEGGTTGCGVATGTISITEKVQKIWPSSTIWVFPILPRGVDFQEGSEERSVANNLVKAYASRKSQKVRFVEVSDSEITCGGSNLPTLPRNTRACYPELVYKCQNYKDDHVHLLESGYTILRKNLELSGLPAKAER